MLSHVNPEDKWPQVGLADAEDGAGSPWQRLTALSHVFGCLQCLCIAPTYELALQIGQVTEQMGKFCPDIKLAYGIRGNRRKSPYT